MPNEVFPRFFPGTRRKASLFYFLQDSQPWLQVDEQDGHEHVEQPQDAHLAAQVQVPLAQPQLESQEQAMVGCRKGSLVLDALESGSGLDLMVTNES